ncbi:hypothetical protein [Brachyspira sp.]|uniref:hypothetical protein n=1 Tax=Brachyspira sp. TaxID=1977261 RepID=UPI003D7CA656
MRLKIFIITSFLIISSALFPDAELEILPKFGMTDSWTDLTKGVWKPKVDINLQAGYNLPINKGMFRGMSFLFDFGINTGMISIAHTDEKYKVNQLDTIELYGGLALKFILAGEPSSPVDLAFGVASGVKFIPLIEGVRKPTKIPYSPYVRLFLEDRIYVTEKMALIAGLDIYYEYMFFDKNDRNRLFAGYNINKHHSIGADITIGLHFGKR